VALVDFFASRLREEDYVPEVKLMVTGMT